MGNETTPPLTKAQVAKLFGVGSRVVDGWLDGECRDAAGQVLGELARPLEHLRSGQSVWVLPEWIVDFMRANSSAAKEGAR